MKINIGDHNHRSVNTVPLITEILEASLLRGDDSDMWRYLDLEPVPHYCDRDSARTLRTDDRLCCNVSASPGHATLVCSDTVMAALVIVTHGGALITSLECVRVGEPIACTDPAGNRLTLWEEVDIWEQRLRGSEAESCAGAPDEE